MKTEIKRPTITRTDAAYVFDNEFGSLARACEQAVILSGEIREEFFNAYAESDKRDYSELSRTQCILWGFEKYRVLSDILGRILYDMKGIADALDKENA